MLFMAPSFDNLKEKKKRKINLKNEQNLVSPFSFLPLFLFS